MRINEVFRRNNGLPANLNDTDNLPLEYTSDHAAYIAGIVNRFNLEPESAYAPELLLLDAMVESIEVK